MTPLVVEVDGRVLRLEGDRTFRIGRSIEADIVMTAGSASRQHAEIRPVDGAWVLVDTGSQFGTFVDGQQVGELPITDRVVVSCGPEAAGSVLTIYPEPVAPAELAEPSHAPAPPPMVDSQIPTGFGPVWPHAGQEPPAEDAAGAEEYAEPSYPPAPPAASGPPPSAPPPSTPPSSAPPSSAPPSGPPPSAPPAEAAGPAEPPAAPFAPPGEFAPPGDAASAGAPAGPAQFAPPGDPGAAYPSRPQGPTPAGFPMEQTTQTVASAQAGGGHPGDPAAMAQRTGPDLLLIAEGREHRFRHPSQVTIGRNPDSTVVLSDPAASRQHGYLNPVAGGWVYTNVSNEGTFVDGRRVATKSFDERTTLRLGHPVAGPEVTLVPILSAVEEEKRIARRRRNKTLTMIGAAAAVLVLITGIIVGSTWFFNRGDDEPTADPSKDASSESTDTLATLTEDELDTAKAATVRITAESELEATGQPVEYSGSGSIIRKDGLILTNAHVATPGDDDVNEKYGIPDDQVVATPDYLTIAVTDPDTGVAEPMYRAEVVASDGELDAAVLHVIGDEEGDELDDDPDLPVVPVGDSADMELNEQVTVLGFPGVSSGSSGTNSGSKPITITNGTISTILADDEELETTARISGGNSGGMAINNDAQLIGVPSYGRFDGRGGQSNRLKSIDALKDLIEEGENAVS